MIIIGGGSGGGRRGCFFLPFGIFFLAMAFGGMSLFPMLFIAVIVALVVIAISSSGRQAAATRPEYGEDWHEQARTPAEPSRIEAVRKLHKSVMGSIAKNNRNPALSGVLPDIKDQCNEMLASAEKIYASRNELATHAEAQAPSAREIQELAMQMDLEKNVKIKAAMEATLERKRAELETRERMAEQIRYMDALLGQAEATLSELKSRIGLTLAETEQYTDPRQNLSLTESSGQLKSVSEQMRQTLGDLGSR